MPKITVNGEEFEFEQGMTVLQACELAGEEIPRFCYHERLKIAGNCRMCLVQLEGGPPKPAASCAMPAADGMVVYTNTPMVKKAREGVMEFLLINHPLDCPICDQGGECDLQDQAMTYGRGTDRFDENKRAVKDKYMGPLIKSHMTRCIHCTRCIRFLEDVAGTNEMGATARGEDMEVGTFIEKSITSELSGNIIDLCPVGALTSKPYAFKARSWELRKTESVDVHDAVGCNIRIDSRGKEVMRILPRLNEDVNEEWISDKSRFAYDGLLNQRLDRPMIRKEGTLQAVSWDEAFRTIDTNLKDVPAKKVAALAGDLVCAESMEMLKELMQDLGCHNIDCRQDGAKLERKVRSSYLFNSTIAGIDQADACLLVGTNPRYEASLVNTRLRKRTLEGNFPIASIGPVLDLTYDVDNLGNDPDILNDIASEKHPFASILKKANYPMIIVGPSAYTRDDSAAILYKLHLMSSHFGMVSDAWNGFNVLHAAASRVAGLDLGFLPSSGGLDTEGILDSARNGNIEVMYLLGADEIDTSALQSCFVIYQGHHGDAGAHTADVILPGAAYTEKSATYVNMEGRVQRSRIAVHPPGQARQDWEIIRDLSQVLGVNLPYETIADVRKRMVEVAPHFAGLDIITPSNWGEFGSNGLMTNEPFASSIENFYMTNPIARASKTMAECTKVFSEMNERKRKAA